MNLKVMNFENRFTFPQVMAKNQTSCFFATRCSAELRLVSAVIQTRSTGTAHTSAKARLTSVAIRIRNRIRIGVRIRDPDRHRNLIICSLAHCQPSLKISCKSVRTFLCKFANRQILLDGGNKRQPSEHFDLLTSDV